jgi:hypothetical protein
VATLAGYLTATRRLLHDATAVYWQDSDLTDYINSAISQTAGRCKQVRQLQTITLTAGQSAYPYSGLTNPSTVDVLGIVVIWGNTRIQLRQRSYTWLTTYAQPWLTYTDVPRVMARYGATTVYLAPQPNLAYSSEWDTAVIPSALVNPTDPDPSPFPFTEPVPYYAAYLAKENQQQTDEADRFLAQFNQRIADCPSITMERMIESMYDDEDLP